MSYLGQDEYDPAERRKGGLNLDDDDDNLIDESQSEDEEGMPTSMLSMALGGSSFISNTEYEDQFDQQSGLGSAGDMDIETFKDECWRMIATAHEGDGVTSLADIFDEDIDDADKNRIKVAVRTRPMNDRERRLGTQLCIEHLDDQKNLIVRKHRYQEEPYDMTFAFDYAFGMDTHQDDVFKSMGWTALKHAFSGFNTSIFAYGQTGSGKSHSMIGSEDDPGLIRRVGEFLFEFIHRGQEQFGMRYTTTVSAAEIYCENVRDLLTFMAPGAPQQLGDDEDGSGGRRRKKGVPKRTNSLSQRVGGLMGGNMGSKMNRMQEEMGSERTERESRSSLSSMMVNALSRSKGGSVIDIQANLNSMQSLNIREGKGGVYVEGQNKMEIRSIAEMSGIIFAAIENRMVRSTNMNADSSRSHLIFTIEFTQTQVSPGTGRQTSTFSKLNLVDLAGSERARTTGTSGDGLREGANINRSLSTLGRVISTLAKGGGPSGAHVPYRDSKLTYILKDSLGGNSKTSMIATISPSEINYEETVSTLRYAASVKRIKTAASQNLEQEAGELIEKLRAECDGLNEQMKNMEIQAEAMQAEHARELEQIEKSKPVKVVRDEKEVTRLKGELAGMSKRAERYRSERDSNKKALDSMEKRADRYRKERKALDERLKTAEKDLAQSEREANKVQGELFKAQQELASKAGSGTTRRRSLGEPETPSSPEENGAGGLSWANSKGKAASDEMIKRLQKRVAELEGLVGATHHVGHEMASELKERREQGSHLMTMSKELERTDNEKAKLERRLQRRTDQLKKKNEASFTGALMGSFFGGVLGATQEDGAEDQDDSDEDESDKEKDGGDTQEGAVTNGAKKRRSSTTKGIGSDSDDDVAEFASDNDDMASIKSGRTHLAEPQSGGSIRSLQRDGSNGSGGGTTLRSPSHNSSNDERGNSSGKVDDGSLLSRVTNASSRLSVDSGFNLFGVAQPFNQQKGGAPSSSSTRSGAGSPRPQRSSGAGGSNSVLVETLRSQLTESNDLNAKLEDKVHMQHDKLVTMSKTVAQLQALQQRLDAKIAESERNAEEGAALREAEKADMGEHLKDAESRIESAERRAEVSGKRLADLKRQLNSVEDAEMSLRAEKDELLASKDQIEEEGRLREAALRDEVSTAVSRADAAENAQLKLAKTHAKLQKDHEKLSARHAELRKASKRLLAEKMASKEAATKKEQQQQQQSEAVSVDLAVTGNSDSSSRSSTAPRTTVSRKDDGNYSSSPRGERLSSASSIASNAPNRRSQSPRLAGPSSRPNGANQTPPTPRNGNGTSSPRLVRPPPNGRSGRGGGGSGSNRSGGRSRSGPKLRPAAIVTGEQHQSSVAPLSFSSSASSSGTDGGTSDLGTSDTGTPPPPSLSSPAGDAATTNGLAAPRLQDRLKALNSAPASTNSSEANAAVAKAKKLAESREKVARLRALKKQKEEAAARQAATATAIESGETDL